MNEAVIVGAARTPIGILGGKIRCRPGAAVRSEVAGTGVTDPRVETRPSGRGPRWSGTDTFWYT